MAVASCAGGRVFRDYFINTEGQFIDIHENIARSSSSAIASEADSRLPYIVFFVCLMSLAVALFAVVYKKRTAGSGGSAVELVSSDRVRAICRFFRDKGYFDEMYNMYIVLPILKASLLCRLAIEDGIFNFLALKFAEFFLLPYKARLSTRDYYLLQHIFITMSSVAALLVVTSFVV